MKTLAPSIHIHEHCCDEYHIEWEWDPASECVEALDSKEGKSRLRECEWIGKVAPQDRALVSLRRRQISQGEIKRYSLVYRLGNGHGARWVVEVARGMTTRNGVHSSVDVGGGSIRVCGNTRVARPCEIPRVERSSKPVSSDAADPTHQGVLVCDAEGIVRQWNPAVAALTGISTEQALRHSLWELQAAVSPATIPYERAIEKAERECRRALAATQLHPDWREVIECELLTPSEGARWVELEFFPLQMDEEFRLAAVVTDQTAS